MKSLHYELKYFSSPREWEGALMDKLLEDYVQKAKTPDLLAPLWNEIKSDVPAEKSLFTTASLIGNFSEYEAFIKPFKNDVCVSAQFHHKIRGLFGLSAVFLRRDIALNYFPQFPCYRLAQVVQFAVKPQLILEYRKKLMEYNVKLVHEENELEFNLFKNPRYYPLERVKYLAMLGDSIPFVQSLSNQMFDQHMQHVEQLNDSFEYFKKDWSLDKYEHLKENDGKQQALHEIFKYYFKILFSQDKYIFCPHSSFKHFKLVPTFGNKICTNETEDEDDDVLDEKLMKNSDE